MQVPISITNRDELQAKIKEASEKIYAMAKASYGPKAGNAILGFKHGAPLLSRDGVTNIKQLRDSDPFVDDVIQAIKQASEKNNKKVGDGTTAVTILTHHLLMHAQKLEGKGYNAMEIVDMLKDAEVKAIKYLEDIKSDVIDKDLDKIATVSAGDEALGGMIADIMREVGKDGGVLIEQYEGLGVHNELIDGFYFHKGYKDTQLVNDPAGNQSNHYDVPVLVSSKVFQTEVDIAPVIGQVVKAGFRELVLIGEVNNAALETLILSKAKGIIHVCPIDAPFTVGGRTLFLDDIALMTGGKVYNGVDFSVDMLGQAKEVLVTEHSTTILDGDGAEEDVEARIINLQEQLDNESHPQSIQFIKDRLARLTNKMAIIKVGGAVEFERDEVKLRVQDAVCAVQSALKDGLLPGGGTALARIYGTEFDEAFQHPFRTLVSNAGLNADKYLGKLLASEPWYGYDLKNMTEEPIAMENVVDPSLVIKEVVTNAIAVVSGLISASAATAWQDKQ